jgi:hypothetical protein
MGRTIVGRFLLAALVQIAAAIALANFRDSGPAPAITVRNATSFGLTLHRAGLEPVRHPQRVPPRGEVTISDGEDSMLGPYLADGCTVGDLVASDRLGREVARDGPGLCIGDTGTIVPRGRAPAATP